MSYYPILSERQKEEKEKNKKLVKTLNKKMFRGYEKIKKLKEIKEYGLDKINKILTPTNEWEYVQPLPFEDIYNITYKDKFLNKLNGNIDSFDFLKIYSNKKKEINKNHKYRNKNKKQIFLTYNNNKYQNKTQGEKFDDLNKKEEEEKRILKQIFPDEDEMNVITSVPFFSLIKNPMKTFSIDSKNSREKKILEEEFLYKLSHKNKEEKNQNLNKGLFKGYRTAYNEFGEKINNNHKIPNKLELNIENVFSNEKISQLTPVERHLQRIENNLNSIRNLPNDMFKEFENNFLNYDDNDNKKNESDKNENEKIITLDSAVFEIKKKKLLNKGFSQTFYNPNYLPKFPIGDYLNQQLKNKEERFQTIHKLAFDDFIKRKSTNLHDPIIKNKKGITISPNSHLLSTKKTTYKSLYDIESKTRDVLIAAKLKTEYSPQDINRILRGYRPWIEEENS